MLTIHRRPVVVFVLIALGIGGLATPPGVLGTVITTNDAAATAAAIKPTLPAEWTKSLDWRCIGPANMGGRITAIAVYEKDPSTWWAATASGGLLKTTNNGVTFEHQFDHESTVSIGDVAVAQSDPNIVWVGTGEANPRNSVSWGDGVYKSIDGGKTWKRMGLEKSFQVGAIAIHPKNPDIVYVGTLGRLWGPSKERGLYKTTDGGKKWTRVLYVNENTGVIDVQMHPKDPETLLAATYERRRGLYDSNEPNTRYSKNSGVWKSTDGGETWERIRKGLPTCKLGRIGIDYYRDDPDTVYLVLESEMIGQEPEDAPYVGMRGEDADAGARLVEVTKNGPGEKAGFKVGDILIAVEGKRVHSYNDMLREVRSRVAGDVVAVEVSRERKSVKLELTLGDRPRDADRAGRGGQAFGPRYSSDPKTGPFSAMLGGQAENLHEHQGPDGHEHGGIFRSTDGGDSWKRINSVNPRPMYFSEVRSDPRDNNFLFVLGVSLHRSKDGGETFTSDGARDAHADHHALWINPRDGRHMILGTDGGIYMTYDRGERWDHLNHVAIGQFYHVAVDPRRNYKVYGGLQDNGSWGGPSRSRDGGGPINQDWFNVGGGDGFVCRVDHDDPDQIYSESQNGGMTRFNLRTGERGGIRPQPERAERAARTESLADTDGVQPEGRRGRRAAGDPPAAGRAEGEPGDRPARGAAAGGQAGRGARGLFGEGRTQPRFNWKTPFILSLHNPRIYYSAGEFVYRSLKKGDELKRISPQITRTSEGTASSLAESPRTPDLLYVGTDDGFLWVSRDGGTKWEELTGFKKEAAPPRAARRERSAEGGENDESDRPRAGRRSEAEESEPTEPRATDRPRRRPPSEGADEPGNPPPRRGAGGMLERLRGMDANEDGKIQKDEVPERMIPMFERMDANGDDVIDKDELETIAERFGQFGRGGEPPARAREEARPDEGNDDPPPRRARSARRAEPADEEAAQDRPARRGGSDRASRRADRDDDEESQDRPAEHRRAPRRTSDEEPADVERQPAGERRADDPISGEWAVTMSSDQMPDGRSEATAILKLDDEDNVTGKTVSQMGEGEISDGRFNRENGRLTFAVQRGEFRIEFNARLIDGKLTGTAGNEMFGFDFEATRDDAPAAESATAARRSAAPAASGAPTVEKGKPLGELLPAPRWVSSIEPSRSREGRVYVTFDGHRSNDDEPYVFVSEDYGKTWRSIRANLPTSAGSTRVIREDVVNSNILYLGVEFGAWVSIDTGQSWTKLGGEFPTVAVHDFAVHPTAGELVAATHGRSLWVLDVTPLRQLSETAVKSIAQLYKPNNAIYWRPLPSRGSQGSRRFVGENPTSGAPIYFSLTRPARRIALKITDMAGETIRDLQPANEPGLHRVVWDLRGEPDPIPAAAAARLGGRGGAGGGGGRGARGGFRGGGRLTPSGKYLVVLKVDGETYKQELNIETDPEYPEYRAWEMEEQLMEGGEEEEEEQLMPPYFDEPA